VLKDTAHEVGFLYARCMDAAARPAGIADRMTERLNRSDVLSHGGSCIAEEMTTALQWTASRGDGSRRMDAEANASPFHESSWLANRELS
jgi:hypothetical protein